MTDSQVSSKKVAQEWQMELAQAIRTLDFEPHTSQILPNV
jgi:hypothetical protein